MNPDTTPPAKYRQQDCPMTILEGLEEYRSLMPDLIDENRLNGPARALFHNHDICHIVFGCDITFRMEGMVDTWSMFGTDVGWRKYAEYLQLPEVKVLFAEFGWWRTAVETVRATPSLLRVVWHIWRMKSRWPWADHERYLSRPIAEVRREFGIVVVP